MKYLEELEVLYVLHHVIEQVIKKDGGRIYAIFVDLKTAFDTVYRKRMWTQLTVKGISVETNPGKGCCSETRKSVVYVGVR